MKDWKKYCEAVAKASLEIIGEPDVMAELTRLSVTRITLPAGEIVLDTIQMAEQWADATRELPDTARTERLEAGRAMLTAATGFPLNGGEVCALLEVIVWRANVLKKNAALFAGWHAATA